MSEIPTDPFARWEGSLSTGARRRQSLISGNVRPEVAGWMVVYVREADGTPEVQRFATVELLRQFVMSLAKSMWLVAVHGQELRFTQPPAGSDREYLVLPDESLLPLFDEATTVTLKTHRFRGELDIDLGLTTQSTGRAATSTGTNAFAEDQVDDEEPETEGEFDSAAPDLDDDEF